MQRFTATLTPVSGGGNYVVVPPEAVAAAGLKYGARVRGTLDGVAYRSSLMRYSGVFHLGVHEATIAAAKVTTGTAVAVTLELDDQPLPTDTVPKDLAKAINQSAKAKAAWAAESPSHKREHVKHVIEAKQAETRARRIAKTVATLAAKPPKKPTKRARRG
jgi:hypothetical protein